MYIHIWIYPDNGRYTSEAFDKPHLTLYATISQTFTLTLFGLVPIYVAPLTLTSVLTLTTTRDNNGNAIIDNTSPLSPKPRARSRGSTVRYYITSQEDLYQTSEFIKFLLPWGIGSLMMLGWHVFATAVCVVVALVLWPVSWAEERGYLPLRNSRLWPGREVRPGPGRRNVVYDVDVDAGVTYIGSTQAPYGGGRGRKVEVE